MDTLVKVSIIIPVYNSIKYLPVCLDPILKNISTNPWELIIVDDHSTDGSYEFCLEKNLKVIRLEKNQGVAKARNIGARYSQGSYLFFLDSDIVVSKKVIDAMISYLDNHNNVHAIGAFSSKNNLNSDFGSNFVHLRIRWSGKSKYNGIVKNFSGFQSECGMIRRETFLEVGGFSEKFSGVGSEEYHLGHELVKRGYNNILSLDLLYDTYWKKLPERFFNLITRTKRWAPLFISRRKFESQGTTGTIGEFWSCVLTCLLFTSLLIFPFLTLSPIYLIFILFLGILGEIDFLLYVRREHSLKLMFYSWPALQLINLGISLGFAIGSLTYLFSLIANGKENSHQTR